MQVFLARRIREELEAMYRESLRSNKPKTAMERTLSASTLSLALPGYTLQENKQGIHDRWL